MQTIYTNMDWKATPSYNPAKSTAGEPDENGIVKCQEGTVARTDEVEIHFCGDLSDENAAKIREYAELAKNAGNSELKAAAGTNSDKVKSDVEALKSTVRLQTTAEPSTSSGSTIHVSSFQRKNVATDGSILDSNYMYDRNTGKDFRGNYLEGLKSVAEDNIADEKAYESARESAGGVRQRVDTYYINTKEMCYRTNLKSDIAAYFGSVASFKEDEIAINSAISSAIKEIEENIANGKEDPTEGLKTKVTVNGTEWNFSELIETVEKINKSFEYFDYKGNLDYTDYAKMGISKANVKAWAKENLSEDKQELVAKAVDAREETSILREKESLESFRDIWDKPGFVMPEEKAKYYETPVLSAPHKEVRDEITTLLEETD
ncbi:MAG: hypothetical protein K2K41_02615, partial [Ruminiclostridium sp.]|nr:hypothetical protein [Ruminiclostridium sp.]